MATREYKTGKRDVIATNLALSSDEHHQTEWPYKTLLGDKLYTLPPRWLEAALAILELPIPTHYAPLAVHGEINNVNHLLDIALVRLDVIRRHAMTQLEGDMHMTMNDYDEVMARLGNVKPVDQRDPFLGEGQHSLIVHSIQPYNDATWGESFRVVFLVEQSTRHPVGSLTARTYNIKKPAAYQTQSNDADSLVDFICTLQGIKLGEHHQSTKALLVSRQRGGDLESQRARGCRIAATGQPPGQGLTAKGKPKTYTKITWQTVPNDPQTIMQNRVMLDAKYPIGAPMPQAPPQQAQQAYGQQFVQQTPQMTSAPTQQYQQPQFAPNVVQPYVPPQQMQPQGYAQPQQPPQMANVYGQPQAAVPATQPQPVQGVPTGGFLAMLPPKQ